MYSTEVANDDWLLIQNSPFDSETSTAAVSPLNQRYFCHCRYHADQSFTNEELWPLMFDKQALLRYY